MGLMYRVGGGRTCQVGRRGLRDLPCWAVVATDECQGQKWGQTKLSMVITSIGICLGLIWGMPDWARLQNPLAFTRARLGVRWAELGCGTHCFTGEPGLGLGIHVGQV